MGEFFPDSTPDIGRPTCRCSPELCQHDPSHAPVTSALLMQPGPDGRRLHREFNAAVSLADDIRYTALIVILSRQLGRHPTDHEIVGFLEGGGEEREAIWMGEDEDPERTIAEKYIQQAMDAHPSSHRNRRHLQSVPKDVCMEWVNDTRLQRCQREIGHIGSHA